MRIWPACLMNNFICESIVKRDKRTRGAVRVGAHAPYCTQDCQYCHTTCRKLKTACNRSEQFYACGPIPRACANPHDAENVSLSYLFINTTHERDAVVHKFGNSALAHNFFVPSFFTVIIKDIFNKYLIRHKYVFNAKFNVYRILRIFVIFLG
jgi:hypothetical protein